MAASLGYNDLALALDLQGALAAAEASLRGALERRESRGAHQRSDYPNLDPALRVNFVTRLNREGEQHIHVLPLPPVPSGLEAWLDHSIETPAAEKLLE
ncbi:MAG: hypothetical protein DCC55_16935 [Chloroflexi bacterium]|nr:MAG: hypothetical protein DCC55_16935 [Chloroflexota bacterium]